ncbi:MAG: hypothetical protein IJ863_07015, partial [Spirochaetales bacterium]|nr:hypothetical protein [Spirochaetales bacterium]
MKYKRIAIAALLIALVVVTGCSKGGRTTESVAARSPHAEENSVYIGIAQDFDSLDPHHMTAAGTKEILFNVFEGLVKPNSAGQIVPAVASEVKTSADGLVYTFTLRDGVRFHNGNAVTMDDVLYSFQRRMDGVDSVAYLTALSVISGIAAEGNTLTITLTEPSNEFLASVMNVYIIPKGYDQLETAPVGTGPYRFVFRSVQDSLVLESFDQYWGEKGKVKTVVFKVLESADGLILGLQSGALDVVAHMSSEQTAQLSGDSFDIVLGSMNLVQALYINNAVAPFNDVRVRQAMCHAIDKHAIIDIAFDGYGVPLGTSMFPSFSKYYVDSLTDFYSHDVEKAKALLADAGYPNGFDMTISVPSNYTPHVNAATVMVEQLREVGINATIELLDWSNWLSEVYSNRNYQTTVTGVTSDNMTARKLLERFGTTTGNNFTNYSDEDYDNILAKALVEVD